MNDVTRIQIEEHPSDKGGRLGRHIEHDPRSRQYAYGIVHKMDALKTVHHRRYGVTFDQGELGSCTGNAAAGAVNTVPVHKPKEKLLHETDAVDIYSRATSIDEFDGAYPPNDTGSSGLAVSKVLLERSLIGSYQHAFDVATALSALQKYPLIIGINWYEGFDTPDEHGLVNIAGSVRGGHEIEVKGFTVRSPLESSLMLCENSWGEEWGLNGEFHFTVSSFRRLMAEQGDTTILIPR
jgi:hypothetical protein